MYRDGNSAANLGHQTLTDWQLSQLRSELAKARVGRPRDSWRDGGRCKFERRPDEDGACV